MIGSGGLLLVVSQVFAVPVLSMRNIFEYPPNTGKQTTGRSMILENFSDLKLNLVT
jgi:hypothetical protein